MFDLQSRQIICRALGVQVNNDERSGFKSILASNMSVSHPRATSLSSNQTSSTSAPKKTGSRSGNGLPPSSNRSLQPPDHPHRVETRDPSGSQASLKRKTTSTARTVRTIEETKDVTKNETVLLRRTRRSPEKPGHPDGASMSDGNLTPHGHKVRTSQGNVTANNKCNSPWEPQASLLPANSAPLASRISVPPQAMHAPTRLNPQPIGQLPLPEQERIIIDDLLFALMGFEGQYTQFASGYNPLEEKSRLTGPQFVLAPGLDPSLGDLAAFILHTATHYGAVDVFVEMQSKDELGTVNHALCATMRKMLKDYLILIAQLEHQMLTDAHFTLQRLHLYLKPTAHLMSQLYAVAQEILKENSMLDGEEDIEQTDDFENILESLQEGRDTALPGTGKKVCKGGAILRLLTRRLNAQSGDPSARNLLTTLLREGSRPYMTMLNEWLHHGNVRDPHHEFLIREAKSIRREGLEQDYTDEYWEKRYTTRPELVPLQLENVKEKILLAGKYLNVVRECGGISNPNRDLDAATEVPHTFDDVRILENVSIAYGFANRSLMTLLLTTHHLPARLRSLKHYFFLSRSDFFSYFLELSHSELRKPSKHANVSKLQSLLDIVLRQPGSVAAEDPYKEDVKVLMNDVGLTGWLMRVVNVQGIDAADATSLSAYMPAAHASGGQGNSDDGKDISGYEALTLDYAVPFPLSLVVSRVTLTRYQLLFRYLLSLRHLETLLTNSWIEHSKVRVWTHRPRVDADANASEKATALKIENWKRRAWCLRSRMLCFVQQLLYFCTSEVIEPNWSAFMSRLSKSEDHAREGEEHMGRHKSFEGRDGEGEQTKGDLDSVGAERTVDELMQDHVDFLATCLKECMLTNSKLLRVSWTRLAEACSLRTEAFADTMQINSKVTATCTMFANYTSSLSRYLAGADPTFHPDPSSGRKSSNAQAHDPAKLDKLLTILSQYEEHFSRHLKILLDALNYLAATETVVFLGLCARLSMANEGGGRPGPGPAQGPFTMR